MEIYLDFNIIIWVIALFTCSLGKSYSPYNDTTQSRDIAPTSLLNFSLIQEGSDIVNRTKVNHSNVSREVYIQPGQQMQITSPNFPQNYSNSMYFTWTVYPPINMIDVEITTKQFNVPGIFTNGRCQGDIVSIEIVRDSIRTRFASYCNTNPPPRNVVLSAEKLTISFASDSSETGRGFSFIISSDMRAKLLPASPINDDVRKCISSYTK